MTDPRAVSGLRSALAAAGPRIGWKVGLNAPAAQRSLGLADCVAGVLPEDTLLPPGSVCSVSSFASPFGEAEVAVEVGEGGRIASVAPAIEVVDVDMPFEDLEAVVAGNVFHRAVVLGGAVRGASLDGAVARVILDGELHAEVSVLQAVGAPERIVRLVGAYASAAGDALRPGDRIICGSMTAPVALRPGTLLRLDLGPLGALEVGFAG